MAVRLSRQVLEVKEMPAKLHCRSCARGLISLPLAERPARPVLGVMASLEGYGSPCIHGTSAVLPLHLYAVVQPDEKALRGQEIERAWLSLLVC
jgi:hypothetical protein